MKTLPLSEAKAKLSKLVGEIDSRHERVTITRNGRPVAMLVSPSDIQSLESTLEITSDPEFMASIRRGIEDFKHGRVYTHEEVFGPEEEVAPRSASSTRRRRARTSGRSRQLRSAGSKQRSRR